MGASTGEGEASASVLKDATRAGAIAWLAGSGVALLVLVGFSTFGIGPGIVPLAAFFYYTFHLWPMVVSPRAAVNFALFAPVPIVLLFVTGVRVATRAGATTAADGFRRGASVAIGYGALAALSLPAFLVPADGSAQLNLSSLAASLPELGAIFLTTGIVFPLVFAGLGGVLAGR